MTLHELAGIYGRLSVALRKLDDLAVTKCHPPEMTEEMQTGAAFLWWYLRELLTVTPKEIFTRDELLVLLDTIQEDHEFFLPNNLALIADAADDEVDGNEFSNS